MTSMATTYCVKNKRRERDSEATAVAAQFLAATLVLDTWQYFMQPYMHANKSLYKHVQSKHHTLAFGARYNHPLEDLLLDTRPRRHAGDEAGERAADGRLLVLLRHREDDGRPLRAAFLVSGMTPRTGAFFFSFATVKTVDDHCGLWLPGNPLHAFFRNNSGYHDVHHQLNGSKYNFSQPLSVMWDRIMGTYMAYSLETRKEGRRRERDSEATAVAAQFLAATLVLDTWQYFMQPYMHANKSLYKHVQSKHHTLAFGARYNHPLEDLLLDTRPRRHAGDEAGERAADGRLLLLLCHREDDGRPLRAAFLVSGMTPRTGAFFFSFATVKTVDDHCGLWLPGNPLHAFFRNNSGYHDVHHQLNGSKYNFSQPLSVMWDRIMGTYMAYSLETRKEGRVRSPADQTQELMGPSISCF
ncbi:hypothetical protein C4D60_Mb08t18460 [Musa balbisiana]|uniref:aldehyde oxygenase (deformylating) n=1 Tax=Musa balbisiana TaxID=52838 RepID=A0A4S8K4R1_MUSBA|nr:hypothetical protein C4D60_Mb08t18460 [Musa balbisiana]